jgi:hypothetical protein
MLQEEERELGHCQEDQPPCFHVDHWPLLWFLRVVNVVVVVVVVGMILLVMQRWFVVRRSSFVVRRP